MGREGRAGGLREENKRGRGEGGGGGRRGGWGGGGWGGVGGLTGKGRRLTGEAAWRGSEGG